MQHREDHPDRLHLAGMATRCPKRLPSGAVDGGRLVRIGLILPQGSQGEYSDWTAEAAWDRMLSVARQAEELGFDSVWVVDHLHAMPRVREEIIFESFATLAALATVTSRVRLGHAVMCAAWRNPGLVAKAISTMDVASGGRMVLGIGAGWNRDEWEAYGFGFPDSRQRLTVLGDHLAVIDAMLTPGPSSVETHSVCVRDAVNEPPGVQKPRIPIMVGGNGPEMTWRIAARFADELNLDGLDPEEAGRARPVIARRCEEIERDPETLGVSIHAWERNLTSPGSERRKLFEKYVKAGMCRVIMRANGSINDDRTLEVLARDARAAGITVGG